MISNLRRYKNVLGKIENIVEKCLVNRYSNSRASGVYTTPYTQYYVKSCYGAKIEFVIEVPVKGKMTILESSDGRIYFCLDGNESSLRIFPHEYWDRENPAKDVDHEAEKIFRFVVYRIANSRPTDDDYVNFENDISPYSVDEVKNGSVNSFKGTVAYKKIREYVVELMEKSKVGIEIDNGNFKKLPRRDVVPIAWVDFNKMTFNFFSSESAQSERSKVESISFDVDTIEDYCLSRGYIPKVPSQLITLKGNIPRAGDFTTGW